MARYARIASGRVAEILSLPDNLPLSEVLHPALAVDVVNCPDQAVVEGWLYNGGEFAAPAFLPPTVPAIVSSAQAKIQCLRTPGASTGKTLLDDITDAVGTAGKEAQIWFAEARTWERANPYVANLSASLKLTSAQVDALFVSAAKIAV